VVIPVMTQHYTMLQRNLPYTGVARGMRLVVLVGQKKAFVIAVRPTALVEAVAKHGLSRRYVSA
jgi:ATP-dependent exoDNAse (exonuclease V) alpha subunit